MGNRKIGKAIAYLRKQKHLTQSELATRLHITDKAVSKWERGLAVPDALLLPRLSIVLDTDIESILSGSVSHTAQRWEGLLILTENASVNAGTYLFSQPLVYFQLGYFLLVGIRKISVVCSEQSEAVIGEAVRDLPMEVSFFRSEEAFVPAADGVMKISGNPFFYGADLTKYFQRAMAQVALYGKDAAYLLLPNDEGKGQYVVDEGGTLLSSENDEESRLTYDRCPVCFYRAAKTNGACGGVKIGRGMLYLTVQDAPSVLLASEAVRLIETLGRTRIYDLSAILRRRGIEEK